MKPRIGITLDWQEKGTFSTRPHYTLREHYFQAVHEAGGTPIGIPHIKAADYLQFIDGLIVPGGFFASPNEWYLDTEDISPYPPSPRLQFDLDIITKALKQDIPLLGICAGMQLMGGIFGCKMTNNIQKYMKTDIDHLNEKPAEEKAHLVDIKKGTLLASITGCEKFYVNTAHKEAVVKVPDRVTVNAVSPVDNVIEGIELPGYRFALGVQWHPEFFMEKTDPSFKLFRALVCEAEKTI